MITAVLERVLRWLDRRSCTFELDGPVIVRDRESWLRITPGQPPRWFKSELEAMGYV